MKKRTIDSIQENEVVHCPTEEQAKQFCKLLHEDGKTWAAGNSYLDETYWNIFQENTCYLIHQSMYNSKQKFKEDNYTITDVSEFLDTRFQVVKSVASGFQLFAIIDKEQNKVVCHLNFENDIEYNDKIAKVIIDSLNKQI